MATKKTTRKTTAAKTKTKTTTTSPESKVANDPSQPRKGDTCSYPGCDEDATIRLGKATEEGYDYVPFCDPHAKNYYDGDPKARAASS